MLADLVIPAHDVSALREIASWDRFRPATFAASEFPVDVVRLDGSSSPPLVISRARRAETIKAMPSTIRARAGAAFGAAALAHTALRLPRGRSLALGPLPLVAGIVNVTPDSFSDGGLYLDRNDAIRRALELLEQGVDLVDIGGESTRPATYGEAEEVTEEVEAARVVPVIEGVRRQSDAPISVDTRRSGVARRALEAGADIVNDVSALRFDSRMPEMIGNARAAAILLHMKGTDPRTMQQDVEYANLIADVARELAAAAERAVAAGIPRDGIVLDPGLGFGKSAEGNVTLLRHLAAFRSLGYPIAAGASRKRFVRRFSHVPDGAAASDSLPGSLACVAAAADAGAAIVRVHDVPETVAFLRMRRAILFPASEQNAGRPGSAVGAAAS